MTRPPSLDIDFADELTALMAWRRDVRRFAAAPLPEGTMEALLRIAALAPSVGNSQPWRFVRIASPNLRERIVAHVDAAAEQAGTGYDEMRTERYKSLMLHGLREAPEILAVFCDERATAGHGLGQATMPETLLYSTVIAIHTLWLAARARGIGVGWVSILDPATVTGMLDVPGDWRIVALLCLGWPERESDMPELERHGWQAREALHVLTR